MESDFNACSQKAKLLITASNVSTYSNLKDLLMKMCAAAARRGLVVELPAWTDILVFGFLNFGLLHSKIPWLLYVIGT